MISSFRYGLAKNNTILIKIDQVIAIVIACRRPSTIRLYCFAPKFCDVKVVIVAFIAIIGRSASTIILLALVCALIIVEPKALIDVCKITVPIETTENISPIEIPCPNRSA